MDYSGIRGVIFDLDGTLLDSMQVWSEVDAAFFRRRDLRMPEDYPLSINSMSYQDAAVYTKARFGLQETPEEIADEWRGMARREYAERIRLKKGAREYLFRLKKNGFRIALATGSGRDLFEPALRNNGVFGLFDAFVTLSDVPRGKEFPDIYLKAASLLGLPPEECLVFEDILAGIKSAKSAGMKTVAVYDSFSASGRESIEKLADLYIENFLELL